MKEGSARNGAHTNSSPPIVGRAGHAGLAAVVPYLVQAVGEGVAGGLRDAPRLGRHLAAVRALVGNPTLDLLPYLHQLLPAVLTCLVAMRLGVPTVSPLAVPS